MYVYMYRISKKKKKNPVCVKKSAWSPPVPNPEPGGMYEWDTIKLPSAWKQEC